MTRATLPPVSAPSPSESAAPPLARSPWAKAVFCALLCLIPLAVENDYYMHIINLSGLYILLVTGLTLLLGFTGQISLGQAGFAGIGSYVSVGLTMGAGISFWPALLAAGLVGAGFGLVIGPVLKVRGHVLAMATLAFAEIGRLITLNWTEVTGGPMGIPGVPPPTLGSFEFNNDHRFFYLILAAVIINYVVLKRTIDSRVGRAMKAIRDDHEAAAASGVSVLRYKIMAFAVAGFFAAVSGALFAHLDLYISPDDFSLEESIRILTMVVIGGMGSFAGSVLGAVTLVMTNEYFHRFQQYSIAVYGLMMILILIFAPSGLHGLLVWLGNALSRRSAFFARLTRPAGAAPAAGGVQTRRVESETPGDGPRGGSEGGDRGAA